MNSVRPDNERPPRRDPVRMIALATIDLAVQARRSGNFEMAEKLVELAFTVFDDTVSEHP